MQLIQIDIVGAQPFQRAVDGVEDVLARHPLVPGLRPGLADALCRDDEALALPLQPRPDDVLGQAAAAVAARWIDVGGIEKVDASVGGDVKDGVALGDVALRAEGHRPEAKPGDAQPCRS